MASEITNLSKLCVHTITLKPWSIEQTAKELAASGIGGITVWRDALTGRNISATGNMIRELGLEIISLCRGGFFPALEIKNRQAAIDDNLRAIDEAAALGAPLVVLVCGAVRGQSLVESRKQIRDGIAACLDHAKAAGVKLTIEPLHPMYAGDRSAVNTLAQANDMAESMNSAWVGIAADVYHLWWDSDLENQLMRCGKNGKLSAFHICDWKAPTLDMLNDRGLMGEGCIDIKQIRGWAEAAGFRGFHEVEIFSNIYWKENQQSFLKKIKKAYLQFS